MLLLFAAGYTIVPFGFSHLGTSCVGWGTALISTTARTCCIGAEIAVCARNQKELFAAAEEFRNNGAAKVFPSECCCW